MHVHFPCCHVCIFLCARACTSSTRLRVHFSVRTREPLRPCVRALLPPPPASVRMRTHVKDVVCLVHDEHAHVLHHGPQPGAVVGQMVEAATGRRNEHVRRATVHPLGLRVDVGAADDDLHAHVMKAKQLLRLRVDLHRQLARRA
eukprot:276530-Chlamydomonas_euryale.AAC.2